MWVRSGLNGERALGHASDDDPEGVDDRHAEHEQRDRDLGRPEDGEHGEREADELDAARPREDRGRVEVPAQEPEQRAGEGEAQDRDQRLADLADLGRQADQAERDGRDERDPGRQAVEAVDPVDAVDHPDDPEDGQTGRDRRHRIEADHSPLIGFAMKSIVMPAATAPAASASWPSSCQPRTEVEQVVDRAERGRERAAEQQRRDLRGRENGAPA